MDKYTFVDLIKSYRLLLYIMVNLTLIVSSYNIINCVSDLFIRELSHIVRIRLSPGVEDSAHETVYEHHVHSPVTQVVLVLDMAIIGQHQVDARLILVTTKLLVQVAQRLGGGQTDQEVGLLLPLRQLTNPA